MNPRQQGDFGEFSAAQWLASRDATVAIPIGHSPDWDLMADFEGRPIRVQVKTSACRSRPNRWAVTLCTRGGNQSWNGLVKHSTPRAAITCSSTSATDGAGSSRLRRSNAAVV
jgi:hypothetical protein